MTRVIRRLISKLEAWTPIGRMFRTGKITSGKAAGFELVAPRRSDPGFFEGSYERPMQEAIDDMLSPGDVFYDIGANLGFFSLVAARKVGPTGRVYAFEPVPRNADAIRRTVARNKLDSLSVLPVAAGARSCRSDLWLTEHVGGASLASASAPPDRLRKIEVEVIALDDWIEQARLKAPDLIKIDVEGAELDALAGLERILSRQRPALLCELDDETRHGLREKETALCEFLTGLGYRIEYLPPAYESPGWHVMHLKATQA